MNVYTERERVHSFGDEDPCAEANREAIDGVLKQIPEMFASNRHGATVGTAAIKACVEALKPVGGRVLAFLGTMPSGGYGALKPRAGGGPHAVHSRHVYIVYRYTQKSKGPQSILTHTHPRTRRAFACSKLVACDPRRNLHALSYRLG